MRLSSSTRRWLARLQARLRRPARQPGGKRRMAPAERRLVFARPWDPEARGGRGGWKPFIQETRGRSGAYVIRPDGDDPYVGSSNAGRLYRTLLHHLQEWDRDKDFWADAYNRTHGKPGETFDRARVKVAVVLCAASEARALEAELMRRYRKKRNEQAPEGHADEVPF